MTAAQHYIQGERLLSEAIEFDGSPNGRERASEYRSLAALHFTAAQVGATILASTGYKGSAEINALINAVTS